MYPLVATRAGHQCEYCRAPQRGTAYRLEIEHIVPVSRGGSGSPDNLALACAPCNRSKGARTDARDPRTGREVRLFHPRQQQWEERFRWSPTYRYVVGRTAVGRATVAALRMNSVYQRIARGFWHAAGLIP